MDEIKETEENLKFNKSLRKQYEPSWKEGEESLENISPEAPGYWKSRKKLGRKLFEKNTKIEEVEQQSRIDPLTKLYNRRFFDEQYARETEVVNRNPDERGLLTGLLDLDDFAMFNKAYGTDVGDSVLSEIANVLKSSLRKTDTAYRWGGEEIAFTMPFMQAEEKQKNLDNNHHLERVRKNIENAELDKANRKISASFGVSEFIPGETFEACFSRISTALKIAKLLGKNRVIFTRVDPVNPNSLLLRDITEKKPYSWEKNEDGSETLIDINENIKYKIELDPQKKPFLKLV